MRLIKLPVLFVITVLVMSACGKVSYRKTPGGMPYQLYVGKGTKQITSGSIAKMHVRYKVNDSLIFSSFETVPVYFPISPVAQPYDISEIWTKLKVGDSVIATQMMDTFIKRNPNNFNPKFKKGDRFFITVKVLDVFSNDSGANADRAKTEIEWGHQETAQLEKYLADKKINCQKTPSGAFVHIINPGTGNTIDSGKYVSVNYTGTSFNGDKFDSNTDSAFGHVGPYPFTVGAQQ
ncbi:MAG: hypothetical protein ACRDEB_04715, partial [Chitinophagaceae bacterium]